jgi:hypothetical protein
MIASLLLASGISLGEQRRAGRYLGFQKGERRARKPRSPALGLGLLQAASGPPAGVLARVDGGQESPINLAFLNRVGDSSV